MEKKWEKAGAMSPLLLTMISVSVHEKMGPRMRGCELFFCARRRSEARPEERWGELFERGEWDWERPGEGLGWAGVKPLPSGNEIQRLGERLRERLRSRGVELKERPEGEDKVRAGGMSWYEETQLAARAIPLGFTDAGGVMASEERMEEAAREALEIMREWAEEEGLTAFSREREVEFPDFGTARDSHLEAAAGLWALQESAALRKAAEREKTAGKGRKPGM